MLGTRFRNIYRYRMIANVLIKHGFGFLFNKKTDDQDTKNISRGMRLRLACEELGPTFIKLGQIASTRHDIIPDDILHELEALQDSISPFPFHQVQEIIETELRQPISELFSHFEQQSLATASIGQVHKAQLHTGEWVAVKVQRPQISELIETDLEILYDLARIAEKRTEWGRYYHLYDLVEEFAQSMRSELNYLKEARYTEQIGDNLKNTQYPIQIPMVFWELTTKRVLTMEFFDGTKLTGDMQRMDSQLTSEAIATHIIKAIFHMILTDGLFHADPHPGNIMLLNDDKIGLLDFGMVGKLSKPLQKNFIKIIIGLMRKNTGTIVKAIEEIGIVPDSVDMDLFYYDVDLLRDKYYEIPFSEVSLAESIKDLFSVARKHKILIPAEFLLLGKSLITLEGFVETLAPKMNIVSIAEPIGKKYLKEQYAPAALLDAFVEEAKEVSETLLSIPKIAKQLLQNAKNGKTNIQITVPKLDIFLQKLDRISNRLSFSIIMLAFSIIMAALIIGDSINRNQTILWEIPAIEIGFVIAAAMFLLLIISIFRSGRL